MQDAEVMDNIVKKEVYAKNKGKLSRAIKGEFWFEAILIEYTIIEDRTESLLRHSGKIKLINSQGNPLKLDTKLNKIKSNPVFDDKRIRKYFPFEFIEEIREWKKKRNDIVHYLMSHQIDDKEIKNIAINGKTLVDRLDSKVKSVNTLFKKEEK